MTKIIFFGIALMLASCASTSLPEKRSVETLGMSIARDPDIRTGVYSDKNGRNLWIAIENLKETQTTNARRIEDLSRSLSFWQTQNDSLTRSNSDLMVGIVQKAKDRLEEDTKALPIERAPASNMVSPMQLQWEGI